MVVLINPALDHLNSLLLLLIRPCRLLNLRRLICWLGLFLLNLLNDLFRLLNNNLVHSLVNICNLLVEQLDTFIQSFCMFVGLPEFICSLYQQFLNLFQILFDSVQILFRGQNSCWYIWFETPFRKFKRFNFRFKVFLVITFHFLAHCS